MSKAASGNGNEYSLVATWSRRWSGFVVPLYLEGFPTKPLRRNTFPIARGNSVGPDLENALVLANEEHAVFLEEKLAVGMHRMSRLRA